MYCSNCGYNVGNDSNFCPVCGKPVQKIDINLNKENTQHEFTQENDTSHENMREVYMRQDYDYSEGSYEGYNGDDSSDDVMEGAASGTRWYDRKRLYTPLIVLTLVHVFITVLFLFNAVGSLKYKAIWLILIVSIACFGEYYLDWRFERRIRHYINIVGNILVIIVCALGFIWVCSAQHNVINCVQSNDFLDGTQTIGEKFDDFFDDVSWYNVEALSDGGVLVQVKGTCGKGDFKHTVDIKFAYLGVNMSDVDEDSELTWGVVSLDGKMLDNEEVYELFGLDNYSGNYSKTDSQNEKDASKTDSDNGKDASKTDKEDKDRFEHDIYLAKKSGKEFSSLNYEDAFNRIFDNSEWRAYDGISYSPDVNGDGISDYSMSNRDIVEFSGECNYIDEDVTMLFQFLMFSQDRYSPVYLEIDGVAQSKAILDEVMDELMFPEKYTVDDGVQMLGSKKVFIMFGMNDIGLYGIDDTIENMKTLTSRIKEKSPDVEIYIQSVTPMLENMQLKDLNNKSIDEFNIKLKAEAEKLGYKYLDVASVMKDEKGNLIPEYCSDPEAMGIHFSDDGCKVWVEYLKQNVE